MIRFKSLEEKLRFLILEVEGQVKLTYRLLEDGDSELFAKIASKDDYIENLKTVIENECFSKIHGSQVLCDNAINYIRSSHIIGVNLRRIADFCVNIAQQAKYLGELTILHQSKFPRMFELIQNSLSSIIGSLRKRNLDLALEICRSETRLDRFYQENLDTIMVWLRTGRYVEDLMNSLFIFRYLEQIGDSLLNIGEALIFAAIGEPIKIDQYDSLQQLLSRSGMEAKISYGDFKSIWGSRSGARIGRVAMKKDMESQSQAIFKEGVKSKIRLEKNNLKQWQQIMPGIAPRVLGYRENGDKASMLIEYLKGQTLDTVILGSDSQAVRRAADLLKETIGHIWQRTLVPRATTTDYINQLKSRLETISRVHAASLRSEKRIDNLRIISTMDLLSRCEDIEKGNPAPFATLVHGDFNTNNILYNDAEHTIRYIDCHRTLEADYIQDASVFLISNFRMPVFDANARQRLNWITEFFFEFFADFAIKQGDPNFEMRMALALVRSFLTSTRFELNRKFAADMSTRSHYLMEKVSSHRGTAESFVLPRQILYY